MRLAPPASLLVVTAVVALHAIGAGDPASATGAPSATPAASVAATAAPSVTAASSATPLIGEPSCVRVGPRALGPGAISVRLGALPAYQRRDLAGSSGELNARFVDAVLVPELLFAAEAERRDLARSPAGRDDVNEVLRAALVEQLRRSMPPVSDAQLDKYYADHADHFAQPERIRIWRILVDGDADAREILTAARGVGGPQRWGELARARSRDRATAMRKGELGFVLPDGRTDVPTVRVDPSLYAAAAAVRDGELVPEPVTEGTRRAVVWRRGSRAAITRSRAEAAPQIRAALEREHLEHELARLLEGLRSRYVQGGDAEALAALGSLPVPTEAPLPPPLVTPRAPGSAATPRPSERGLR